MNKRIDDFKNKWKDCRFDILSEKGKQEYSDFENEFHEIIKCEAEDKGWHISEFTSEFFGFTVLLENNEKNSFCHIQYSKVRSLSERNIKIMYKKTMH